MYWISILISEIIFMLIAIAIITLMERKVMGSIQRRRGPNILGIFGLLQPFADGCKALVKEIVIPSNANATVFLMAPILNFACTIVIWLTIPIMSGWVTLELPFGILFILGISSISVHTIIFAGWASNSKYAFLGGVRSASQMISYEICLGTIFCSIVVFSGTYSLVEIVKMQLEIWYVIPLLPIWIIFMITALAETNRAPFDLPEAEAELVAGYNVEYSAITFAMFFLAEYGNMIIMSSLSTIFFWGGWYLPIPLTDWVLMSAVIFGVKVSMHMFIMIWIRAALPRYRYDQLMKIGWKVLIPITFSIMMLETAVMLSVNVYPIL